jgi:hypothetical protein
MSDGEAVRTVCDVMAEGRSVKVRPNCCPLLPPAWMPPGKAARWRLQRSGAQHSAAQPTGDPLAVAAPRPLMPLGLLLCPAGSLLLCFFAVWALRSAACQARQAACQRGTPEAGPNIRPCCARCVQDAAYELCSNSVRSAVNFQRGGEADNTTAAVFIFDEL